ncbi:MAG TPA: DUF4920 domain-containing protein [Saprospiraceae bacterium]|nr:DUF4920 domain-containing protein [Saprospiraceae bacterium]
MKAKLVLAALFLMSTLTFLEAQESNQNFGETFTPKKVMKYDRFVKKLSKTGSVEGVVKGRVEAVCQMKGCWMNIVSDKTGETTTVKFKDYGFFVPMDITGQTVIMKGQGYKEETSVDELRHLAEDAGKSKEEIEAITEPKEEFKFLATGVILVEESK